MSSRLSKESEVRITSALEKAADLISAGTHPNEAIIKTASEDKIPAGHIHLMVNAINIGRTNAQRLTNDDPLEKAADFPIAETNIILNALYPSKVKTKAAEVYSNSVDATYNKKPLWLKAREQRLQKVASKAFDWKLTDKKVVVERDPDFLQKQAITAVKKLYLDIEAKRLKVAELREKAANSVEALKTYFKTPGHIRFTEIKENSDILFGKQASAILVPIAPEKDVNYKYDTTKVDLTSKPYSFIQNIIKLSAEFKLANQVYLEAEKLACNEATRLMRPFVQSLKQAHSVMDSQLCHENTKHATIGNFLAKGLGVITAADVAKEIARKIPTSPQSSQSQGEADIQSLMDPAHDAEIRNIQSESLLNDLMANDDVIKGYDPEEVVDAFNEVSQLTPYASNKKAIMRDLMRKRLSGGAQALDQFTVSDALKTQEMLRGFHTPAKENLSVLQSTGAMPNVQGPPKSVMAE